MVEWVERVEVVLRFGGPSRSSAGTLSPLDTASADRYLPDPYRRTHRAHSGTMTKYLIHDTPGGSSVISRHGLDCMHRGRAYRPYGC